MSRKRKAKNVCVELEVMLDLPRQCGDRTQLAETPARPPCERIPRVTRLLALAVKYQDMVVLTQEGTALGLVKSLGALYEAAHNDPTSRVIRPALL
jgi:hypothetical protein